MNTPQPPKPMPAPGPLPVDLAPARTEYKAPLSAEAEALLEVIRDAVAQGPVIKSTVTLDRKNAPPILISDTQVTGISTEELSVKLTRSIRSAMRAAQDGQVIRTQMWNDKGECVGTHLTIPESRGVLGPGYNTTPGGTNGFDVNLGMMQLVGHLMTHTESIMRAGIQKDALTYNELHSQLTEVRAENAQMMAERKQVIDAYWRLVGESADVELKRARNRMQLGGEQAVWNEAGKMLPLLSNKLIEKFAGTTPEKSAFASVKAFHDSITPEQFEKMAPFVGGIMNVLTEVQQSQVREFLTLLAPQPKTIEVKSESPQDTSQNGKPGP